MRLMVGLIHSKKIDGTMYVVQAVAENKYNKLWVTTAYVNKKTGLRKRLMLITALSIRLKTLLLLSRQIKRGLCSSLIQHQMVSVKDSIRGDAGVNANVKRKTPEQIAEDKSKILYVEPNEKITHSWLSVNRLQLPLPSINYGFINRISHDINSVNISILK